MALVICVADGVYMAEGVHGGGHAWQGCVWQGGMCGRGVCMAGGEHGRGHVWQGVCGRGTCMVGRGCVQTVFTYFIRMPQQGALAGPISCEITPFVTHN